MSEPKFDNDDPDAKSMFDFLAEEGAEKHRRQKRVAEASGRSLPIIRKPVPVSESGPLLPPKPGAPVEPPPELTGRSTDVEEELDFLDDIPDMFPGDQSRRSGTDESGSDSDSDSDSDTNITTFDASSRQSRGERNRKANPESDAVRKVPSSDRDDFIDFDLSDAPEFSDARNGVRAAVEYDYDGDGVPPRRSRWLLLLLVLIAASAGPFLFADPAEWRALVQKLGMDSNTRTVAEDTLGVSPGETLGPPPGESPGDDAADISLTVDDEMVSTASPLMQRFRDKLMQVEGLIADGALDDAEKALTRMDRTVYGYGATEFGDLEIRIKQLRSGVAEIDRAAEQVERDNAERIEAEQAVRDAAAQMAREEQARIVATVEQAAQEESARRAAAEQSARQEQVRIAAQRAAQEEQARVAAEDARQQAARRELDEKARSSAQAGNTSDRTSVNADRQATDRRIAEERASVQRQQARWQRLIEAREREVALEAQAASQKSGVEPDVAVARNTAGTTRTVITDPQSIDDDELQTVYRRFIDLQQAVSSRDINAVVSLTQRSGVRVQQLMQMFENSTQIDARIRNVSTSNATGQIKGTLQINRIKRANGTFVEPPAALSSIPLSSQREGDGWSAISW